MWRHLDLGTTNQTFQTNTYISIEYVFGVCLNSVQATVAGGGTDDNLRVSTQTLALAAADYRRAAKSAHSLYQQNKPKSKAVPKPKATPAA